jgi:hypothetical protein
LETEDVYKVLPEDSTQVLGDRLYAAWKAELRRDVKPSLLHAIWVSFKGDFFQLILIALASHCVVK